MMLIQLRSREVAISLPGSKDERPVWNADRQRAHLRGFARVRAILWRRSIRIYEWCRLAGQPWYPPLCRELKASASTLDLHSAERVHDDADVFGETPILTVVTLLHLVEARVGTRPNLVVDLGSGRGVPCLTASSLGIPALGLEQEASWVASAEAVARALGLEARFRSGDFLQTTWPEGEGVLLLAIATSYPTSLRHEMASRLAGQAPGALIVTADWSLDEQRFALLWKGTLPVDWGTATFSLWRV